MPNPLYNDAQNFYQPYGDGISSQEVWPPSSSNYFQPELSSFTPQHQPWNASQGNSSNLENAFRDFMEESQRIHQGYGEIPQENPQTSQDDSLTLEDMLQDSNALYENYMKKTLARYGSQKAITRSLETQSFERQNEECIVESSEDSVEEIKEELLEEEEDTFNMVDSKPSPLDTTCMEVEVENSLLIGAVEELEFETPLEEQIGQIAIQESHGPIEIASNEEERSQMEQCHSLTTNEVHNEGGVEDITPKVNEEELKIVGSQVLWARAILPSCVKFEVFKEDGSTYDLQPKNLSLQMDEVGDEQLIKRPQDLSYIMFPWDPGGSLNSLFMEPNLKQATKHIEVTFNKLLAFNFKPP